MFRASFRRAVALLVFAGLAYSSPVFAQTATPGTVEFTPSADQSVIASDGTPILTQYNLSIYQAGQSTALQTLNLGKPSPGTDGLIRVEFLSKLTVSLTPGQMYETRVSASGPGGTTVSTVSNQFQAALVCTTSLGATSFGATSAGGSSSVSVNTPTGCAWTAASNAAWLTVTSGATGSGPGSVGFNVAANTTTSARSAALTIGGVTFTVSQAAFSCSYSLASSSQAFASTGGTGSVALTAPAGCGWTASSNAAWLTLTSAASGTGSTTVGFSAAANTSTSPRSAALTIGGQTFNVSEAAFSCSYTLSAASQAVAATGGTGSVDLTAPSSCAWTASSSASWLTLTSAASGTGSTTVGFNAAGNTSTTARTATLTIGGQAFAVTQPGVSCSYSLTSSSQSVTSAGGTGSFSVTAPTGCAWTTTSSATWLSVTSGQSGNGNGTVAYSSAANSTTASRSGTLTISGQSSTVGVTSAASTTAPLTDDFNRADGDLGFSWRAQSASKLMVAGQSVIGVAGQFSCSSWSPSLTTFAGDQSSQVRIAFLGAADSIGVTVRSSGSFATNNFSGYLLTADGATYSVLDKIVAGVGSPILDLSSVRWANGDVVKLSITGQTLTAYKNGQVIGTVTDPDLATGQPGGCIFDSPTDGISTSFDDWSGENFGTSAGSVVGTQSTAAVGPSTVYTVNQAGVACSSTISPLAQSVPATGGSGSVAVLATSGCPWTSSTSTSWLTIKSGSSGTGDGALGFTAAPNTGTTTRTGTITIAGQTFTVTQAAASCSYTVSPLTVSVGASGTTSTVTVTTASGCAWSAVSASQWISVTPGAGGTGTGSVTFSTTSNGSSTARTGSLTVAGQTVNVSQAGMSNCSYTLSTTSRSVNKKPASGSFSVTATNGCSWTATSTAAWLAVTSVNTSKGTVAYSVTANPTGTARTGTISVNGVVFTLTQRGDTSLNTVTGVYVVSGGN